MAIKKHRGSVTRKCVHCGDAFSVWLSTIAKGKGHCCGKACATANRVGKKMTTKRKTRCDKLPRRTYTCQWCGKAFTEGKRRRNHGQQYCSSKCSGLSKRKDGREHPRRKQSAELTRWARAVILRDKKCVRCGTRESLQAHHVDSYVDNPELRLDVENGVALCAVCHHFHHPVYKLEWFLNRGGRTIQRCVVCEGEYLPHKKSQRTCSPVCGSKLRYESYGD